MPKLFSIQCNTWKKLGKTQSHKNNTSFNKVVYERHSHTHSTEEADCLFSSSHSAGRHHLNYPSCKIPFLHSSHTFLLPPCSLFQGKHRATILSCSRFHRSLATAQKSRTGGTTWQDKDCGMFWQCFSRALCKGLCTKKQKSTRFLIARGMCRLTERLARRKPTGVRRRYLKRDLEHDKKQMHPPSSKNIICPQAKA